MKAVLQTVCWLATLVAFCFYISLAFIQPAMASDVYIKQDGSLIGRLDGGYLPITSLSCDPSLACSVDRNTQTGTVALGGWRASLTWDFPSLGYASCAVSRSISVPGAEANNFCFVKQNFGQDGGASISVNSHLWCDTTPNAAIIHACSILIDGGAVDLPDAGYSVLVFP